jgi:tRNA-specific 2-thiouridylase
LQSPWLQADDVSWVAGNPPPAGPLAAKTRYRQTDAPGSLSHDGTGAGFRLDFDEPQWAVTPGQSAVLYEGEVCLGGGVISAAQQPVPPLPAPRAHPRRRKAAAAR